MNGRQSCRRWVAEIVDDIENLPRGPFWYRDVLVEKSYRNPISLDAGNGQEIFIRPEIDHKLSKLAAALADDYFLPSKSRFFNSEWDKIVKKAFGAALSKTIGQDSGERDSDAVLAHVRELIEEQLSAIPAREYVFGCYLFGNSELKAFSIGPIQFVPRLEWVRKMNRRGVLSRTALSRIERTWKGKKLRTRKPSEDELRESHVLGTIGKCDFVCIVPIGALGAEAGLRKALTAASLATTTIALAWNSPSWALGRIMVAFERIPHLQQCVVMYPSDALGWWLQWSDQTSDACWMKADEWDRLRSDFKSVFACAGEAIQHVTTEQGSGKRPQMMDALSQALLWFHEGCRENVDAMAIVKFCSAMDALACGKEEQGILALMKARLRVFDESELKRLLREIYGGGRSRTVHGTNDRLGHDWSDTRRVAESFARECLMACLDWVWRHESAEEPSQLAS